MHTEHVYNNKPMVITNNAGIYETLYNNGSYCFLKRDNNKDLKFKWITIHLLK